MLHRTWIKSWSSTVLGKYEKLTHSPRSPKIHFQRFFTLSFLQCTEWSLCQLIGVGCGIVVNLCYIFSKATQPFDFIKPNIFGKLAYKVKYISQINVGLIWNLRIRFFQISWPNCEQYRKNQYKKKQHNQQFRVQNVMITFILSKCHRSIDNSTDFYLFTLLWKGSW